MTGAALRTGEPLLRYGGEPHPDGPRFHTAHPACQLVVAAILDRSPIRRHLELRIKIALSSLMVDDQAKALTFYTEVLGFVKKTDLAVGEARWIELLLEPNTHPAAKAYQAAIIADGIPAMSFACTDVQEEYERLTKRGVVFRTKPTKAGPATIAVFADTCGNLIQLHQV